MQTKPKDKLYNGVDPVKVKNAEPTLDPINFAHMVEFIDERYRIHLKKDVDGAQRPYTNNEVLRDYKFTNVRREHDRVSKELIAQVSLNPYLTLQEKIANTFLFRSWNNPETFRDFGGPWSINAIYGRKLKEKVRKVYHELLEENPERKWWSSAYNQGGTKYSWKFPEGDGMKRAKREVDGAKYPDYEADIPLRVFHVGPWLKQKNIYNRLMTAQTQKQCFEIIKDIRGFADFLAYQIFVDLTYIPEFPFSENEFVIAGPGCKRGIDLVFTDKDSMSYEECLFWLRDNFEEMAYGLEANEYIEFTWNAEKLMTDLPKEERYMNIMSLENCFCELSKYIRAVTGTGRPRNKYKPFNGGE